MADLNVRKKMSPHYYIALTLIIVGVVMLLTAALWLPGMVVATIGAIWWVAGYFLHKSAA